MITCVQVNPSSRKLTKSDMIVLILSLLLLLLLLLLLSVVAIVFYVMFMKKICLQWKKH